MLSAPGALAAGLVSLPGATLDYARTNTPADAAEDAANLGRLMAESFSENPADFLGSMIPSPVPVAELRAQAKEFRDQGDLDTAEQLERYAAAMLLTAAIPGANRAVGLSARGAAINAARFAVREADGVRRITPLRKTPQIVPQANTAPDIDTVRALLAKTELNQPARIAGDYASRLGLTHDPSVAPPSSLAKQAGIGRAFGAGVEGDPAYKHALYERYGAVMPEVVEKSGARNYDQLVEAAYRQLGGEVKEQFSELPVTTTFHGGDMEYPVPSAMFKDVLGRGNLNVFRGGDRHPFLGDVDTETGLTGNEMFRAVHDYFGHVPGARTFRADGEEAAYASHAQMMSPLSRLAMAAETRGQNSFVNYSPLNADTVRAMETAKQKLAAIAEAKRTLATEPERSWKHRAARELLANAEDPAELRRQLRDAGARWKYAPQQPILLPPEHLALDTAGGIPEYLAPHIRPEAGTTLASRGVHMGAPGLTETDPAFYGTGHRGAEYAAARKHGAPPRTYVYLGEEGTVNPEAVLTQGRDRVPYAAQLSQLYDPVADPARLRALAEAYGATADPTTSLEQLVKQYGYEGTAGASWGPGQRPAMVFRKTPIKRLAVKPAGKGYACGGAVRKEKHRWAS
jgi:hypothetical protein